MNKPIYPKLYIESGAFAQENNTIRYRTTIMTHLRKKHKGKWYLIFHINEASSLKNIEESKFFALEDLSESIYSSINFMQIDPELKHPIYGNLLFPLDEFQGSEYERWKSL